MNSLEQIIDIFEVCFGNKKHKIIVIEREQNYMEDALYYLKQFQTYIKEEQEKTKKLNVLLDESSETSYLHGNISIENEGVYNEKC